VVGIFGAAVLDVGDGLEQPLRHLARLTVGHGEARILPAQLAHR